MTLRKVLFFTLLPLIYLSCENATKEELKAIHQLNDKFKDFEFTPDSAPVGIYLDVKINKASWDSLELKNLYDSSVGRFKGRRGISWAYLSVHDKDNKYLFTISKYSANDSHVFFID